ncbi:MAG TPA: hypothetical protein VMA77_18765 [Solirubrobacteraceae bacterium]|nr:hypothetical protein [Solirubrobacteraceae bacterium]
MKRSWSSVSARTLVALVLVTVAAISGTTVALASSSAPAGGAFRVFGVSTGLGGGGTILVTGAIGDHGHSESVTKSGQVNQNGSYVKLTLSQGTLTLNKTALDNAINRQFGKAAPNQATCSLSAAASGNLPFVSGTGLYAGATGSAHITVAVGFILPRKNGKCDTANSATPTASQQIVFGAGSVSFN